MQRREVFAVWVLLSAPIIGFVLYLLIALGIKLGNENLPLTLALLATVVSLFFLSWTFLAHASTDWRTCARFMSVAFVFEGAVLASTKLPYTSVHLYFGIGSIIAALILFLATLKH